MYKIQATFFNLWNRFLPSVGQLSVASFFIAIVSGIILALAFDLQNPYSSVQIMLISNSSAAFFRNLHFWSGQLFLISTIWHIYEHLFVGSEKEVSTGVWLRLIIIIPFIFYVMLSGFILKGDSEAILARQIFVGLTETIPKLGELLRFSILGSEKDYQIIYLHHITTATIFVLLVIIEHTRRVWAEWISLIYILALTIILSSVWPADLNTGFNLVIKGPWYFIGLQEILHWISNPGWLVLAIFIFMIMMYFLPRTPNFLTKIIKIVFFLSFIIYFIFSVVGWIFRGENWEFVLPF